MSSLSLPMRRALAVGILIVALLSVWSILLRPLYRVATEAVEELDNTRFELHRLTLMTEDAARTVTDAPSDATEALQRDLLSLGDNADSSARLLSAVDPMIRRSGLRLLQMKALPAMRVGPLEQSALDVTATGQEAQVVQLLADIEGHHPLLVIERLVLLSQSGASGDEAPDLSIELRVAGFSATLGSGSTTERSDAR